MTLHLCSAAWGVRAFALLALSFTWPTFAQGHRPIDLGTESLETIATYRKGQTIRFQGPDGQLIEAIFVKPMPVVPGEPQRFEVTGVKYLGPAGPSSAGPATGGDGGNPASGAPSNSAPNVGSSEGSGAGAAAMGAAVTIAGYIAVPPALRAELKERAGALQEAIRKGQVALELQSTAATQAVAGADSALAQLKARSRSVDFTLPAGPQIGPVNQLPNLQGAPLDLRRSLESSFVALTGNPPPSPAHAQVRATGLHAVSFAQGRVLAGDVESARDAAKIAEAAASVLTNAGDLLLGLNPLTAMAKDATELLTGKELLTGRDLSEGEMWMRGLALGASLVTGGTASTVRQAISRIAPMVESVGGVRKLLDYTLEISRHARWRWIERAGGTYSEAAVRDFAFDAIKNGRAFYDARRSTTAFFVKKGDNLLQIAIDVKQGKAVTYIADRKANFDFSELIATKEGPIRRWISIDAVPLPTVGDAAGNLKIYLPGVGAPPP